MLNLKKTAVAVLALSSGAAFAGTMGPVCSAVNVTVPCETTAWDFGAKALYLQPSVAGLGVERTITTGSGTTHTFGRNPQWAWGFMIEGSYHFNTGNDINLNWYHLNQSSSRSFAAGGTIPIEVGPLASIGITPGASSFSTDPHWDAVNLEVGQHVDFGENKSIRFHGGAEYARLTNSSSAIGTDTVDALFLGSIPLSGVVSHTDTSKPSYNGFGPRVGADMAYDWGNGLGVYANGAAAILAGSSKTSITHTDSLGNAMTMSGSRTTIVPELEAKLGANYTYAMAQGDLTLDAGWMWINYFNAKSSALGSAETDFGLQGPYIGLKWLGNVA